MASDVVSVRLWLPRIKVEGIVVDAPERLVVRVCSTVRRPGCPDWGTPGGKVHDRGDNKIRDLEVSGRPVTLVWDRRRRQRCRVLLVDETSIRKRHRYVTVIVNGDTGEVLAMVAHRDAQALSGFLAAQGPRWCKAVKVVVCDGSAAYKAAIEVRLGHARHVLDRFHVIRWFAAGLTAVRRDIQRRPEGSVPAFDRDVSRPGFLLMRRPDKLDPADHNRLDKLFAAHPRLRTAWEALAELHNLYLADDSNGALEALDRFADIYCTAQIPEFSDTVDTFLAWHDQILDWHHAGRPPNGRIDRTNNLLQVLRRKAHGFTNYTNFEARGLLLT